MTKKTKIKHGKTPAKEAKADPWETLCVDLIGPFKIPQKRKIQLDAALLDNYRSSNRMVQNGSSPGEMPGRRSSQSISGTGVVN
jgi:hypothetical protein